MSNLGFIKLPRSLLEDPLWKSLPYTYRHVYLTILANVVFKPTIQDDFGVLISLSPGQFLTTERELVRLCDEPDIDKSLVHRALEKFKKLNFSNQTSNHKKTIITISRADILELIEPNFEPNSNQTRTKLEPQKKNDKNDKNDKNNKDIAQTTSSLRNESPDIFFSFSSKNFENISLEDIKSWQEIYPAINAELEIRRMVEWCLSNPTKAKSKKQWRKFITGWMQRNNEEIINKSAYKQRQVNATPKQNFGEIDESEEPKFKAKRTLVV